MSQVQNGAEGYRKAKGRMWICGDTDHQHCRVLKHTSFSLDRYTHVTTEMQSGAAEVMGNFYEKIIGKEVIGWADEKTAREA